MSNGNGSRKEKNIEIFQDTMDWIKKDKALQEAVKKSLEGQKLILEDQELKLENQELKQDTQKLTGPSAEKSGCRTVVSKKRSFEAASAYAREGKKVCVLNFASATNPGGGVTRGSSAQEECLCRCSTLYPCLEGDELREKFYQPHRKAADPLYNNDCIYTPGVMVVKSDIDFPKRMEKNDWYQVDVITCAAPNLRIHPSNEMNPGAGDTQAKIDEEALFDLHVKRIERIFMIAAENGAEVLILGAFGCGAFCNPPEIVAGAFKEVSKRWGTYFETVEYAVYCGKNDTANYDAFYQRLGER